MKLLTQDRIVFQGLVASVIENIAVKKGLEHISSEIIHKISTLIVHHIHDMVHSSTSYTITHVASHTASHATAHVATHTIGATISIPLVKAISVVIVKLLSTHIAATVMKILSSSAFKAIIAGVIKKFMAAILLTSIVKAVAIKFGISAAAVYTIVLIPIVGAYIYHEVTTFPKQLGRKVSEKVREELNGNFREININILEKIFDKLPELARTVAIDMAADPEIRKYVNDILR